MSVDLLQDTLTGRVSVAAVFCSSSIVKGQGQTKGKEDTGEDFLPTTQERILFCSGRRENSLFKLINYRFTIFSKKSLKTNNISSEGQT